MDNQKLFRTSVLVAAALACASSMAFPIEITIHNDVFLTNVEPETSTVVEAYGTAKVAIRDADQLLRIASNIEQLNAVNGWVDGAGLGFEHDELAALHASAVATLEAQAAEAAALAAQQAKTAEDAAARLAPAGGTPAGGEVTGEGAGQTSLSATEGAGSTPAPEVSTGTPPAAAPAPAAPPAGTPAKRRG